MVSVMLCGMTSAEELTVQTMNDLFTTDAVRGATALPNSDSYLQPSNDGRQIIQYSFKTGKQEAVIFDVANTIGATIDSFDSYTLSPDGTKMLIATDSEPIYRHSIRATYYIYTIHSRKLEPLSDGGKQQVPIFSNDGNQIAFVRENNIYLVKMLYDNAESAVTTDGKVNAIINGVPDWVNEEEFSFNTAMCFNADGTKICWLRYDETAVPEYSLPQFNGVEQGMDNNGEYPATMAYKYPTAGQTNSIVTAWSYDIKSHRPQKLQVPITDDMYIPRIIPTNDPEKIIVYTLNRAQNCFTIYAVNPSTTLAQMIIEEKTDRYLDWGATFGTTITDTAILLPSDRSGYTHIYVYNFNGQVTREIGQGTDIITHVYGYDDNSGDVYCQIAPTPQDRYIAIAKKNGKIEALTDKTGWNIALFSHDRSYFINTWSDRNTPYLVTARNNKGKVLATIYDNADLIARQKANQWNRRTTFSFTTSEGVQLNGWRINPDNFDPAKKYPVVMYQYSGPGSQQVVNGWHTASMGQGFDYLLAQEGYIVVCVDGRGTGGRGADFEKCVYQRLGQLEAKDQVETALWLAQDSNVDKDRIAIWGWSFGGFNTLMSMSEGRGVFAAGVSVAPVTSWRYYDTIFTERYMRTPKENPEGYDDSPISRVNNLHGALLICHGTMDDNVHPQNVYEYTDALVEADKDFREVVYTNRNHNINTGKARTHLFKQLIDFLNQYLK